jgi:hypothetical protein
MAQRKNLEAVGGGLGKFDRLSYLDLNFILLKYNNKKGHWLARPATARGTTNQLGGIGIIVDRK